MTKNIIEVVGFSVDAQYAVLYKADGSTVSIPQGDIRLPKILETVREPLSKGLSVKVDITLPGLEKPEYAEVEKGTNGIIKFFRVAKKVLKDLVNTDSPDTVPETAAFINPLVLGNINGPEVSKPVQKSTTKPVLSNEQKLAAANEKLEKLTGLGISTDNANFYQPLKENETIVAVDTKHSTIIPDVHLMTNHLKDAVKLQNFTGFTKFSERLSNIINDRGHSIQDLMKFMEKGDLPIADDGCIVVYKRLKSTNDPSTFVDSHTGKISQKLGSFVFMRHGLVDPNRRRDCSNGLHIGSVGYMKSFYGDVTVICKVRPEDVFAVPEYNVNKMRVCGYHLVHVLDDKLKTIVNSGNSISKDPDGALLLANILAGNHVPILQHVEIGDHNGSEVKITDVAAQTADQAVQKVVTEARKTVNIESEPEILLPRTAPVKASDLMAKPVKKRNTEPTKAAQMATLFEQFKGAGNSPDLNLSIAQKMVAIKKAAKVSWSKLGITDEAASLIIAAATSKPAAPTPGKVETSGEFKPQKPADKPDRKAEAKALYEDWKNAKTGSAEKEAYAKNLKDLKRKAKVSWTKLGLPESLKKRSVINTDITMPPTHYVGTVAFIK